MCLDGRHRVDEVVPRSTGGRARARSARRWPARRGARRRVDSQRARAMAGDARVRARRASCCGWRSRRGRRWHRGAVVALVGEALRIWAAGHLEKSREVTRSGPYRFDAASAVSRARRSSASGIAIAVGQLCWSRRSSWLYLAHDDSRGDSRRGGAPAREVRRRVRRLRAARGAADGCGPSAWRARSVNREHHTIAGSARLRAGAACAEGPAFATIAVPLRALAGLARSARRAGRGRLAQLVEHRLYTPAVTGSSPVPPTRLQRRRCVMCAEWRLDAL